MIKEWVIAKMTEWHEGPHGGHCPNAGTERECSQYGIRSVRRFGAIVGTVMAARHVVACRPKSDLPEPDCGPGDTGRYEPVNPRRLMLLIPCLVGLHLREALPRPQPGSSPCAGMDLSGGKLPEKPCGGMEDPGCLPGVRILGVLALFARLALFGQAPPGRQCGRDDPHGGRSPSR